MDFSKVLLIHPPTGKLDGITDPLRMLEPLGLEYVAAAFSNSMVKLQDMRIEPDLKKTLHSFKPDLIGFTALTCHANTVKRLAKYCKETLPRSTIMVGGQHATLVPTDYDMPEIDIVIRGNGYSSITEYTRSNGKEEIEGVCPRVKNKLVVRPVRGYTDIDGHSLPRRDLAEKNISKYRYLWHFGVASIQTSVGCPYRCNFCSTAVLSGGSHTKRKVENVVDELKTIKAKVVYFTDDECMVDHQRMSEMADQIKIQGINKKYISYVRIDDIINNSWLIAKWRDIGLSLLLVGYESPVQNRLDKMNKNITSENQIKATKILRDLDVPFTPMFIIDTDFDRGDFKILRNYVKQNGFLWPSYDILTPFPGSKLYEKQKNSIIVDNWDYYDGSHAVVETKLENNLFYDLYRKLIRDIGLINRIKIISRYPLVKYPEVLRMLIKSRVKDYINRNKL